MDNGQRWTYCEIVQRTTILIVNGGGQPPAPEAGRRALPRPVLPALPAGLTSPSDNSPTPLGRWGRLALSLAGLAVAGALAAKARHDLRALPGPAVRALPAPHPPAIEPGGEAVWRAA